MIYNTDTDCLNHFAGGRWYEHCGTPLPGILGSSFTAYDNGAGEYFSNLAFCQNKFISAGHTTATCSGSVTVGSNTYPVVLINTQCWMQSNLKEVPSNFNPSPTYNAFSDVGWSGFYGDSPTEITPGDGFLYTWKAAMNGSTTERAQGVCPPGWHVPSDCEFMYLEHGLGLTLAQQTLNTGRSAGDLRNDYFINPPSGFSARLARLEK